MLSPQRMYMLFSEPFCALFTRRTGEGVVVLDLKVLAAVIWDDERVELAVVLEDAAAVDADYLPLPLDYGVGADGVRPVERDGPVADDDPTVEGAGLARGSCRFSCTSSRPSPRARPPGRPPWTKT